MTIDTRGLIKKFSVSLNIIESVTKKEKKVEGRSRERGEGSGKTGGGGQERETR